MLRWADGPLDVTGKHRVFSLGRFVEATFLLEFGVDLKETTANKLFETFPDMQARTMEPLPFNSTQGI